MKKGVWILVSILIVVILFLISYGALWMYDSVAVNRYLEGEKAILLELNPYYVEALQCVKDGCIENDDSINGECYEGCLSLTSEFDSSIEVSSMSPRQEKKFSTRISEFKKNNPESQLIYQNLYVTPIENSEDVDRALAEFRKYSDTP
ncbi:hypothetical protein CMI46_02730 [Candidatus Pacearchaeota archaeon]|nr:hypothetical protein [Candidatus Pacearchaeota archaeon]|tara:strand:+ start:200 stop:643 length:444 start_codon:yes stop_codon:yes gene_type:complete